MTFLFAANRRFQKRAQTLKEQLTGLGLNFVAIDLGGMGFGEDARIYDNTFQTLGFYRTRYDQHPSRSMHKPSVVSHVLESLPAGDVLVYLDTDIEIRETLTEIEAEDFDVGITVADVNQRALMGWLNAGVIFFRANDKAKAFVRLWEQLTVETGNDQIGLIRAVLAGDGPVCRVREFPQRLYNCRCMPGEKTPGPPAKVVHFMDSIRDPAMERMWQLRRAQDRKQQGFP